MRNGNYVYFHNQFLVYIRSYPTYEEWKPAEELNFINAYKEFLSYLWGMETQNPCDNVPFVHLCSYPTYEEWKLLKNLRR